MNEQRELGATTDLPSESPLLSRSPAHHRPRPRLGQHRRLPPSCRSAGGRSADGARLPRAARDRPRRQAELAQAEAKAKTAEETKRRRLTLVRAAAVVLLVGGAGAAGWRYQQDQMAQAQKQAKLDAE